MAAALLHAGGRGAEIATRFARHAAAAMLAQVIERPTLSPQTSSLGRHFDAAAGLLGICEVMQFEAEAAIALERLATQQPAPGGGSSGSANYRSDTRRPSNSTSTRCCCAWPTSPTPRSAPRAFRPRSPPRSRTG